MIINRYFLISLAGLCFSIGFYCYFNLLGLMIEILILLILFLVYKRNIFLITIIIALLGALICNYTLNMENKKLFSYMENENISGTFQVTEVNFKGSFYTNCTAEINTIENNKCKEKINLTIYGLEEIKINSVYKFNQMEIDINEYSDIIAYGSEKIFFNATVSADNLQFDGINTKGLINKLRSFRSTSNAYIEKIYNSKISGFVSALLTGDKTNLPQDIKDSFNKTGISHILSVSGMHVVILMSIMGILFDRLGKFKYLKYLFLLAFVCFTGAPPSIIRAASLSVIMALSEITYETNDNINTLSLVALISLLFNPLLLFNKSFQLSYLASYAIIATSDIFYFESDNRFSNKILKIAATTISAQLVTLPVMLTFSNTLTLLSVTANIIALTLLPVIYGLIFLSLIIPLPFFITLCESMIAILYKMAYTYSKITTFDITFSTHQKTLICTTVFSAILCIYGLNRQIRVKRQKIKEFKKEQDQG